MRVVIDLTSLADNFSGIERYALNISQELISQDYKMKNTYILVFKRKIYPEFNKYKQKNVEFIVLNGKDKLFFGQFILPLKLYFIKADRYLFLAFPSPLLFFKRGIYNIIHDITCWDCPETMPKKMQIFFRLSIRNALFVSKGIIVVSKFTRNRVRERLGYRKKIILAHCGISKVFMDYVESCNSLDKEQIERNYDEVRRKYHLPKQYLLCLATLEPRKNLPFLVNAYLELLEEKKLQIPLVLAGRTGWNMEQFLEQVEADERKNIIITGFIDEPDLPYIYHMADCFLFPSLYEGFGMPPLEALTVGTIVIASNASALPEVLGNAAIYFKLGNKEELKDKIQDGIAQKTGNVSVNEIKKIINTFQWDKSAKKIADNINIK